jgi:hypothetical protein
MRSAQRTPTVWLAGAVRTVMLTATALCLLCGSVLAETLDASVQRRLHGAVFEVLLGRPQQDPLSYEKALPLDLLPFNERDSHYLPVGTAFVIDHDRFVTAAHVVAAGIGSQNGPLAVRDSNGTIYLVDQITKYSAAEDYAEFTVHNGPHVKPLDTDLRPQLNEPVFAVGNALGEGIVIRDGLYTSDTPEERSGRWKWLRFSAAASPGNSGGPLVDRKGRVIGVILRKSPNENLNVAVAIAQVRQGSADSASMETRFAFVLPPMLASEPAEINEHFALPREIADFFAVAGVTNDAAFERIRTHYLEAHAAQLFPHGSESDLLLNQLYVAAFPRAIAQRPDQTWGVSEPKPQKAQLEQNGFVESQDIKGFFYLRLRTPDELPASRLYGDSNTFMDLLLKALLVRRPVGTDSVRVTSLGAAREENLYVDPYGRSWQVRSWVLPYNDSLIITFGLPTPEGYIVLAKDCPTRVKLPVTRILQSLTSFTYVSLEGTLKQWRDYLEQPAVPDLIRSLDIRFDYGKSFQLRSKRVTMNIPNSAQNIEPTSTFILKTAYFRDGETVVWDVGGLYLSDADHRGNWLDVLRRHRPLASLPDTFADRWHAIESAGHPYTAIAYAINGGTRIEAVANASKVRVHDVETAYTVSVNREGTVDQPTLKKALDAVMAGVVVLEK